MPFSLSATATPASTHREEQLGCGLGGVRLFQDRLLTISSVVEFGYWTIRYTGSSCSYSITPPSQS